MVRPIHYQGTLRVNCVIETGKAFVEWWVTFECDLADQISWTSFFEMGLRQWMASLNTHVGDTPPTSNQVNSTIGPAAYFSGILSIDAATVWSIARDFGDYRLFTSGRGEVFIEDKKPGDCVGAIRN